MFSIDFYKKLNWAAGLMAIGLLFGLIAFAASVEIKDLDLWLHLRMGEWIVQHGYVPSTDVLSCSFLGKPWINHEWLFQVVVYNVKSLWGVDGLIYMQAGVVVLTFLIFLLLTYHSDRQLVIVPLFLLIMHVYETRFTIRPDIFSVLFFSIYIYILSLHLDKRWSLWVLLILQIIWTNMHGYSMFGIVFVAIGLGAEWIKRHVPLPYEWGKEGRLTEEEFKRLGFILIALVLATLVNPLTIKGAWYPFSVLLGLSGGDSKIFFKYITELKPSLHWASLFDLKDNGSYKALIFLSGMSFLLNRRRVDVAAILFWLIFLIFSITAIRNMIYFAFTAYLVTMVNLSHLTLEDILPFKFKRPEFIYLTGVLIAAAFIIRQIDYSNNLAMRGYYDFDKYERKPEFLGVTERFFPFKAADFLKKSGIKGNFFNDFNSGSFFIGHLHPNVLVYIDGRTELRGGDFFKSYQKTWGEGDEKVFDEVVKKYDLTGAFANSAPAPASAKFLKMIYAKKDWKVVYFDYDGVVFLRDVPQNAEAIKRYSIDLTQWKAKEPDFFRIAAARVIPYQNLNRAVTLKDLGLLDQAALEADVALKLLPNYIEALQIKGDYYVKHKEFDKAFICYRSALAQDQGNLDYRNAFVRTYIELGHYSEAVKEAKKTIENVPDNPEALFILFKAYVKNKQYKEGYDILWRVLAKKPKTLDDVLMIGDVFVEEGAADYAVKAFEAIVRFDKTSVKARLKLGDAYEKKGNKDKAVKSWKKALELSPKDASIKERIGRLGGGNTDKKVGP